MTLRTYELSVTDLNSAIAPLTKFMFVISGIRVPSMIKLIFKIEKSYVSEYISEFCGLNICNDS